MSNFLKTLFIYPIKDKILLSKHLNCWLDNPRTTKEINIVKKYVRDFFDPEKNPGTFPTKDDTKLYVSLESLMEKFNETYSARDSYVSEFSKSYVTEEIYDYLARMWVIARFDDEGETERLIREREEDIKKGIRSVTLLNDGHPIVRNSENLVKLANLLSLLIQSDEDYYGLCFLMDNSFDALHKNFFEKDFFKFAWFAGACFHVPVLNEQLGWTFLPNALKVLESNSNLLDVAFEAGDSEKLLYIGELLSIAGNEVHDDKIKLLVLNSIIELLVTHQPSSRFNVEDSITKQYLLKASSLIYMNDKKRDINQVRQKLKEIYEQRSNIAHGNFFAIKKYQEKLEKNDEHLSGLVSDLYLFVKCILNEHLHDKKFVDFLKNN